MISERRLGASAPDLRQHNRTQLLLALLAQGPMARTRLARATGLASPTVFRLVEEMLQAGVLREEVGPPGGPRGIGRPASAVALEPRGAYVLCLFLGTVSARLALADLRLGIVSRRRVALEGANAEERLRTAVRTLLEMADEAGASRERLLGIGVGSSGVLDGDVLVLHPWLGWRDVPVGDIVASEGGLPVMVDGSVRATALAEAWFGHGRASGTLALLSVGSVVTSAVVVDRSLVRGRGLVEGQIGHLPAGGDHLCSCGRRGCIEVEARDQTLLAEAMARHIAVSSSTTADVYRRARVGSPTALALVAERGDAIARAVAVLEAVFDPGLVVLAGPAAVEGRDAQIRAILSALDRHRVLPRIERPLRLLPSRFRTDAGVGGAAALVLQRFYQGRLALPGEAARRSS